MLPSFFDYIFVHLRQKARLRPVLNPNFSSTLGPNPIRKARAGLPTLVHGPAPKIALHFTNKYWCSYYRIC